MSVSPLKVFTSSENIYKLINVAFLKDALTAGMAIVQFHFIGLGDANEAVITKYETKFFCMRYQS